MTRGGGFGRRLLSVGTSAWSRRAVLAGAVLLPLQAIAQSAPPALQYETDTRIVVADDRSYRAEHTVRTRINTSQGLVAATIATLTHTDGVETLEVTRAHVEKEAGTTIDVPLANLQTRPPAPGQHKDTRTKLLAFGDLSVGDTTVYTTVREVRLPPFEGHFSYAWTFARNQPWVRARHSVVVPAALALQVDVPEGVPGLSYERIEAGNRHEHVIAYAPAAIETHDEFGAVAPADRDPGFALTTFADHEAFAAAYWRDAGPKAAVTPEIQALAREITRDLSDPLAQVTAIDRWIKRNIRYSAIFLGRERWLPQAAASVLATRSGDSKDHAVLMTALLEAIGLGSNHVLVNLGASYALPKLPPASFNHVMVHVPAVTVTLDPSSPLAATGVLALQAYDKPVLHVGKSGVSRARTPPMVAAAHRTTARTVATIGSNGTISGETTQTATGIFANSARTAMLRLQVDGAAKTAEQRLLGLNTPGTGLFTARSPSELQEPYEVVAKFELADKAELPLAGNRRLPIGLPVHGRPGAFLLGLRTPARRHAFFCFAGIQVEDISLSFADGLALPRVPLPKKIAHSLFTYEASYTLQGRTLRAVRTFTSQVAGQVCPASADAGLDEPMKEVQASLGTVLVFPPAPPAAKKKP